MMDYLFAALFLFVINIYVVKTTISSKKLFAVFFMVMLPWLIIQGTDFAYFDSGDNWLTQINDGIATIIMLGAEFLPLYEITLSATIPFPFSIVLILFAFLFNSIAIFTEIKVSRHQKR